VCEIAGSRSTLLRTVGPARWAKNCAVTSFPVPPSRERLKNSGYQWPEHSLLIAEPRHEGYTAGPSGLYTRDGQKTKRVSVFANRHSSGWCRRSTGWVRRRMPRPKLSRPQPENRRFLAKKANDNSVTRRVLLSRRIATRTPRITARLCGGIVPNITCRMKLGSAEDPIMVSLSQARKRRREQNCGIVRTNRYPKITPLRGRLRRGREFAGEFLD